MIRHNDRGAIQIAAAIANAALALALLFIGAALTGALLYASLLAGGESWASLGTRVAAALGEDSVALLALFGLDVTTLVTEFAASAGLPAFDLFARGIIAALYVGVALFLPVGVTAAIASRSIWRLTSAGPRGLLNVYAAVVMLLGLTGLLIAGAPHLIWGLVVVNGVLTLLALRRASAATPPYSA